MMNVINLFKNSYKDSGNWFLIFFINGESCITNKETVTDESIDWCSDNSYYLSPTTMPSYHPGYDPTDAPSYSPIDMPSLPTDSLSFSPTDSATSERQLYQSMFHVY